MTEDRMTLKEMCARFNVTPRTLRHYEYIELLAPEKVGRTRYFGPRECARLELILRGRRFGFSLEEVRQWLEMYNQDKSNRKQMEVWVEMSDHQIRELESRMVQLQEVTDELRHLRDTTKASLAK